ncbi:MAG: hypothetical protein Q8R39_03755 [bacterium]|nr:hypothetical protein [bacterium]
MDSPSQERISRGSLTVLGEDDLDVQLREAERSKAILKERMGAESEGGSKEKRLAEQELQRMLGEGDGGTGRESEVEAARGERNPAPSTEGAERSDRKVSAPPEPLPEMGLAKKFPSVPPVTESSRRDEDPAWDAFFGDVEDVSHTGGAEIGEREEPAAPSPRDAAAIAPGGASAAPRVSERAGAAGAAAESAVPIKLDQSEMGEEEKKAAAQIFAEIEKLPPTEREEVALGFENWNLAVKKFKGRIIDRAVSAVPGARKVEFIDAWARNFNKEYLAAKRDIERIREEKESGTYATKGWWGQAKNIGYLYGTAAKFARPALSAAGFMGWPYKVWMLGALAAARAAEVGAQVSRQRVATTLRGMDEREADEAASELRAMESASAAISREGEDAEARRDYELEAHEGLPAEYQAAYDEAWNLYAEAREKPAGGEQATREALDAVYASSLPQGLAERIALGSEDQQRDWLAQRMQRKVGERIGGIVQEIDAAKTPEEKEALVKKHRATLEKYDALIDSTGRVHVTAVRLDRLATAGKLAVAGLAIETGVSGGWALAGAVKYWWERVELVANTEAAHFESRGQKAPFEFRDKEAPSVPDAPTQPPTASSAPPPVPTAPLSPSLPEAPAAEVSAAEAEELPKAPAVAVGAAVAPRMDAEVESGERERGTPTEGEQFSVAVEEPHAAEAASRVEAVPEQAIAAEEVTGVHAGVETGHRGIAAAAREAAESERAVDSTGVLAEDVATTEEAEKAVAAMRETHAESVLPGRERLPVRKGDSPLRLAKKLYAARAQELGYTGDMKNAAALERWATRASTRQYVGQWLVEHAGDSKEPMAQKFFEDVEHEQLLARWKEHADRGALETLVRHLRVGDFNDILKEKAPNLSLAGGHIELDERGNILSIDSKGDRLLGHSAERRASLSPIGEREPVSPRRDTVAEREQPSVVSVSGEHRGAPREADTPLSYTSFWERSGFEKPAIVQSVAERAGITPQALDRREELLLDFWGKHPHAIAHDSPREARQLFETLSRDPAKLESQLSFLDHFAYRRETLSEAEQVLRVADLLSERVAATDIYRSILANYEAVRHVADATRQADILELFLSHGASKQPLERLTLGWNRTLFRGVSASLDESLDLRVRFSVRSNAVPVDMILYRNGRVAVDGHGFDGNWPARRFKANALPLTEDSLREALAFISRSDGEGAVFMKSERNEGMGG